MDHVPPPTSAVLAGLLQYRLDHHPDGVLNVYPSHTGDADVVTYRDFALGCQRFMRAVCPQAPVARGKVVGLLLQCDTLVYQTAICGLVRAGLTVSLNAGIRVRPLMTLPAFPHLHPFLVAHDLRPASVCLGLSHHDYVTGDECTCRERSGGDGHPVVRRRRRGLACVRCRVPKSVWRSRRRGGPSASFTGCRRVSRRGRDLASFVRQHGTAEAVADDSRLFRQVAIRR
jgi:hypothetical protein